MMIYSTKTKKFYKIRTGSPLAIAGYCLLGLVCGAILGIAINTTYPI